MNSNRESSTVFHRYAADRQQPRLPMPGSAPDEYAALEIDSREGKQEWLRLHQANGLIRLMPYADLRHVIHAPPGWLVMECEEYMVTVVGRNLLAALALLQSRQLAAIYCLTGDYPSMPEGGEPVVLRLLVQTYDETFAETGEG